MSLEVKGDRLEYAITTEPEWLPVPVWMVPQEFFDIWHLGHRHRKFMLVAELVDRGPDFVEFRFGQRIMGLPTPRAKVRTSFARPCQIRMQMAEGPLRGSRVEVRVTAKDGGMIGEETHILQAPNNFVSRALLKLLPPLLPAVKWMVRRRSTLLRAEDIPAFKRMANGWLEDEVIWYGDRLHFPPGSTQARLSRLDPQSIVNGCADCGRYDMGYLYEGKVRCVRCDYFATHIGPGHQVRREGCDVTCTCVEAASTAATAA